MFDIIARTQYIVCTCNITIDVYGMENNSNINIATYTIQYKTGSGYLLPKNCNLNGSIV